MKYTNKMNQIKMIKKRIENMRDERWEYGGYQWLLRYKVAGVEKAPNLSHSRKSIKIFRVNEGEKVRFW